MIFSSRYQIDIPAVDILTYVFGTPALRSDPPLFVDAEKPSRALRKGELETCVKRLAGGLRQTLDLQDDDVVVAFAKNCIWYPVVFLGAICAGGIFSGANLQHTSTELIEQLSLCRAKCVFTDTERLDKVIEAADAIGLPRSSVILLDGEGQAATVGFRHIRDLFGEPLAWQVENDTGVLRENSGTTGKIKACMITHYNFVANGEQTLHLDRMSQARAKESDQKIHDVHCIFSAFSHASGLLTCCVANVRRSCTTVVLPEFRLETFLGAIQEFRVTHLLLAPPVVVPLLKSDLLSRYDVSSVTSLVCGAAPLQPDVSKRLENVFNPNKAHSRQGWGMTEATMAVTLFAPHEFDPSHKGVGYLLPNMRLKVVSHDGREVGYEEEGEAFIQGPNIFKGYYKDPDATRENLTEDGWLKTGDVVKLQRNGLLTIVDRKKEFIKVGGVQVAPAELEGYLLEHELVKDCAVIRVMRDGQECPQAHIVPANENLDVESIVDFMEHRLAAYKRLTGGIVFTKAIPKSGSGKILRRLIQDPEAAA
ncbi:Acyl-CoA ligase azaF [Colletotrichum gloeosporioides]|uniref:Acyl-CoA ligase azaF n=1 Tax=Colletotrichum gloeosporioides TaxID=474922 RepID=A0A8H4C6W2_COLGL|nr:Acyl-CoA ligase azaF [Colletotrichum gloeosporioides]KAF3798385.1 Acyl-CoA ligase azaF [Colletotrichum gloeosporioides]